MALLAVGGGIACGLAGRVVYLLGLYDIAAGLGLGAAAVALCHLAQRPLGAWAGPVAMLAAGLWMAAAQTTDAWAFRQEQAQWLQGQPLLLAQDLAVAGVDDALALVDAGLRAETGADGLTGSWLAQGKAGVILQRAIGSQRVLPAPLPVRAAVMGGEIAFVALVVWRALQQLAREPVCPVCRRFLRRRPLGRVGQAQVDALRQAWALGDRALPTGDAAIAVALVYEDTCTFAHLMQPGLALVGLRGHRWGAQPPGPLAMLPAIPKDD